MHNRIAGESRHPYWTPRSSPRGFGLCIWIIALSLSLVACTSRFDLAPVSEITWQNSHTHPAYHHVRAAETLYAVAFRYDMDYRQLARYNHLQAPYTIHVGQLLRLTPSKQDKPLPFKQKIKQLLPERETRQSMASASRFYWPVKGRLLRQFAPQRGQKGIDIIAPRGTKITAAANGVIAYVGQGLIGYKNLIIIKHSNQLLTAYGNHAQSYVKEGQHVLSGQTIGIVGQLDKQYWGIHFEIRRLGQPVNPLHYLK